tara:strand:- start:483 stop:1223 length:741 start_codon:yes stop_codon:yes gene_type:complete
MGKISFNNFGYVAEKSKDYTISASRFFYWKKFEKKIILDIVKKLSINEEDKLLDVGCNVGNQLIPLSFIAKEVYGLDHVKCIKKLKLRFPEIPSRNLISGNFLNLKIKKKFTKVLSYSVLQYLENKKEVFKFSDKILQILEKNGVAMLGDIPNKSMEKKFYSSRKGKVWLKNFHLLRSNSRKKTKFENISSYLGNRKRDKFCVEINNELLSELVDRLKKKSRKVIRIKHGTEFALPSTREDIIIYK